LSAGLSGWGAFAPLPPPLAQASGKIQRICTMVVRTLPKPFSRGFGKGEVERGEGVFL